MARVNNVNYIVNYKIFARARDLNKSRAYFFAATMQPRRGRYSSLHPFVQLENTASILVINLVLRNDSLLAHFGLLHA